MRFRTLGLVQSVLVTVAGFLLLGLLVGWLWSAMSDPPRFTVTGDNGVMDEVEAAKQFGVSVTYAWLSVVAAAVWGTVCALRYGRFGWPHVMTTVGGACAAALVAWRLGVVLGPPDPTAAIKRSTVGDQVPTRLVLDSHGLLLIWPVAALLALIVVVTWLVPEDESEVDAPRDPARP